MDTEDTCLGRPRAKNSFLKTKTTAKKPRSILSLSEAHTISLAIVPKGKAASNVLGTKMYLQPFVTNNTASREASGGVHDFQEMCVL